MRKVFAFFASIILLNCECLDPKVLRETIENNKPVHIITLTRVPIDKEGNPKTEDSEYFPITMAEATTVFELTNFLLGGKLKDSLKNALSFDQEIFLKLKKIDTDLKENPEFRRQVLEKALAVESSISERKDIQSKILSIITSGKNISIEKNVIVKLDGNSEKQIKLSKFPRKATNYSTIASLKPLISNSDYDSISNLSLGQESNSITFEYKLDGIPLERDLAVQMQNICDKFSLSSLEDTLKAFLLGDDEPTLSSYASISEKNYDYYLNLYQKISSFFKNDITSISEPCLLIVNEQFFGKNFIFPHNFSLLDIVPEFSANVIACINLLEEEQEQITTTSKVPSISKEEKQIITTSTTLTKSKDLRKPEVFFTAYRLLYRDYVNTVESKTKFFRNVSFYLSGGKLIHEYTKSSYCKEYDSLIEGSFAYLFGSGADSNDPWNTLLSTQICFDLSSGVRERQTEVNAPIHIIQSNRLNIDQYILNDPQKLTDKNRLPGNPEIVVHSDPSWPEVFISNGSFVKTLDLSFSYLDKRMHYQRILPDRTFRFFIGTDDCKSAYTITHWIVNKGE